MSRRDLIHDCVRSALEKANWTITDDPLTIPFATTIVEVDLGAERLLGASRGNERIAVEIKSFYSDSPVSEFHVALGQYLNYRRALEHFRDDRKLFLAIPGQVFDSFFQLPIVAETIEAHQIRLIVVDTANSEILKWTE